MYTFPGNRIQTCKFPITHLLSLLLQLLYTCFCLVIWDIKACALIMLNIRMNSFARVSRLVIFALSIETGTAVSSSFLPDTFTAWFWLSCKHLSLPCWYRGHGVPLKLITLQHSSLINGSISMAAMSSQNGTVQTQLQVLCGVRHPLDNYPGLI